MNAGTTFAQAQQLRPGIALSAARVVQLTGVSSTQSSTAQAGANSFSRSGLDRVAGLYVSEAAGVLLASAGGDVNISAAQIINAGTGVTQISAGGSVNLGTVQTGQSQDITWDANNYLRQSSSREVGSQVSGAGAVQIQAQGDVNMRAAQVQAAGALSVDAAGNVVIEAGTRSQSFAEGRQVQRRGLLSSKTSTTRSSQSSTDAVASELGGQSVAISSLGNIDVQSSGIAGQDSTTLVALGNIVIGGTHNSSEQSQNQATTRSGLMLSGGLSNPTLDFKRAQSQTNSQERKSWVGSRIGSDSGSTRIESLAGGVSVTGAELRAAPDQTLSVRGAGVVIAHGLNEVSQSSEQRSRRTNLHLGHVDPSQGVGAKVKQDADSHQSELARSRLSAGRVELHASGSELHQGPHSLVLQGVDIQARELALAAPQSTLHLNLGTTTHSQSSRRSNSDLMYQKHRGQGGTQTQGEFNSLSYDTLQLQAQGVQIQLPEPTTQTTKTPAPNSTGAQPQAPQALSLGALLGTDSEAASTPLQALQALAQQPQTAWVGEILRQQQAAMQADPQSSLHAQQVLLASQQWNYKQQGLTEAGAAVVALVVAYFTAGAASSVGISAASGAGMTTAAGAAGASTVAVGATGAVLSTSGAALSAAVSAGLIPFLIQ